MVEYPSIISMHAVKAVITKIYFYYPEYSMCQ